MSQEPKKPFDFKSMFNMDSASQDDLLRGEIYAEFERINARLSPMIWALAWREMEKARGDHTALNAIVNSLVNACAMFVAASIDEQEHLDDICDKMTENYRNCFKQRETARQVIAQTAPGEGRALLIEESLPGIRDMVGQVATGLTATVQGLATVSTQISNLGKA